jgi:tetratricopeptide (TPR) repeat protein
MTPFAVTAPAFRRGAMRFALIALAFALCAQSVPARAGSTQRAEHVSAPLWREVGRPGHKRAHALLEQALLHVHEGNRQLPSDWRALCNHTLAMAFRDEGLLPLAARARALRELARQALRRRAHLDSALVRLRRAAQLDPDDADVQYTLGRVLMAWEQPGPAWTCSAERRDQEASDVLLALRAHHPDYMPDVVAFDLAVVLTRRGQFAQAAQAYADAIALGLDGEETAVMRSNLAEVTMLSGDLEGAVAHYERALRTTSGGRDYLLTLWGLAVALDRLGEHESALAHARKAVDAEGGRMQVLRSDGVFFEPEHEIHAYEGLGHEALAARSDADRALELSAAAASYRAFIDAAGSNAVFSTAARADLDQVEAALRTLPPPRSGGAAHKLPARKRPATRPE